MDSVRKPLSFKELPELNPGDKVDYRRSDGYTLDATVLHLYASGLKLRYMVDPDNNTFATSICSFQEIYRLAKHGSISKRTAHRLTNLTVASFVDVNVLRDQSGWRKGTVLGVLNGQCKVCDNYFPCNVAKHTDTSHITYFIGAMFG